MAVWAAGLGTLVVVDIYCDSRQDDSTLSCVTRHIVSLHPAGKHVFTAAVIAGGMWFHRHIVSGLPSILEPRTARPSATNADRA